MIRDTAAQDQVLPPSTSRHFKRGVLLILALAVLLLAIVWVARGWLGGSHSVDSTRLRTAQVTRGDLVRDIAADGRVIAANNPVLYAISAGTVELKVVAGDVVKQGQELAVIDSPELRSRLAQEQATLAGLEAQARRAELDARLARANAARLTDQARIERQAAARELERNQRGFAGGAVAQVYLSKAQDDMRKAEITLQHASADADLQDQGANLDASNARQMAQRQRAVVAEVARQVDALTLRAPFDGQVGQVHATQRTQVAANAPVLGVVDLTRFEVEIRVPESFARDLAIGMPAQLTSGNGTPVAAEVAAVSPEVVGGEVTARLRFAGDQPPGLRQSQRLSARILLDTRKDVLKLSRGPFVEADGGRHAWVVEGRTARRIPVRLGVQSLGEVEVLDGLSAGQTIVIAGTELFGKAEQVTLN